MINKDDQLHPALPFIRLLSVQELRLEREIVQECQYEHLNRIEIFFRLEQFPKSVRYLLAVLTVEDPQNEDVDERDEKGRMCIEFLFLHKDICPVTQVEVQHDKAHFADGQ